MNVLWVNMPNECLMGKYAYWMSYG